MNSQTEDIWFNDIMRLFEPDNIFNIVPTSKMSLGAKVNAVTRFSLYLAVILSVVKQNYLYLYVFIVPVIISYIVYIFSDKSSEYFTNNNNINTELDSSNETNQTDNAINNELSDEELNEDMKKALYEDCQKPTRHNPLMNVLLTDNFQKRKPACNISDPNIADIVSKDVFDTVSEKLYNDTSNIYNSRALERPFITMPNSSVPNDQTTFAKWLYHTPVSCASGEDGLLKQNRACAFNNKPLNELVKEVKNLDTNN